MDISDFLNRLNSQNQFDEVLKKYKNKKIILYGAGQVFDFVKKNYNLSALNIIAVADKKFETITEPVYDEKIGYNIIAPLKIHTLNPDIVLLCVLPDYYVERYICEELFAASKSKFKYEPLFKMTLQQKIAREWELFDVLW